MRKKISATKNVAILLALLALAAIPAVSAQPETPIARIASMGAGVMWVAESGAPELVLSVSGPNVAIRKVSVGGGSFSLSSVRDDGSSLPDGTYKWEIRESLPGINDGVSDPANGRDGANARPASARVEIEGRTQSGVFSIKGGFVVDSTVEEAAEGVAGSADDKESK